jgi:hypothetical protein
MTADDNYSSSPEELKALLGPQSAADLVLLASHALRAGSLDCAAALGEAYGDLNDPALGLAQAAALFGLGQQAKAVALVDGVLARNPEHLTALFFRSQMAQAAGDIVGATDALLRVLERFPDFPGALGTLAGLHLPGPPYRDVLRRLHELLRPRTYLEIGVETGATLALAAHAERAIGIDPNLSKLRRALLPPKARVFEETSDAFFARETRETTFGGRALDLAFIDGMHWFEYALRDFVNVEAWSSPNTVAVLHDCLPVFPATASRERRTKFWVGDVWKIVPILREFRPELRIRTIMTAPSGLCVVRGLDAKSRVLPDQLDSIIERFRDVPYTTEPLERPAGFELVPATDEGIRQALA